MFSKNIFTEEIMLHPHHFLTPNPPSFGDLSGTSNVPETETKKTSKKNRHSKITTAQGPRDRRVRLSIGIARKFFNLQEMLEFDKPSETLDWLLTNSETAINELLQKNKEKSGKGIDCSSSESTRKVKESVEKHRISSKESRAKARDRARERTKEKMCIKNLTEENKTGFDLQFSEFLAGYSDNNPLFLNENLTIGQPVFHDLIHEPGSKLKNPSFPIIHQNLALPHRVFNSNYTTGNWDNFNPESNLYIVFDQHKFINSGSNQ